MQIKIVHISDTHGLHRKMVHKIPECDILLHSGDYTNRGERDQVEDFFKWLTEQKQCTRVIFTEGNHDIHTDPRFEWETKSSEWFEDLMDKYAINHDIGNIMRLENTSCEAFGLNIWGSPMTPSFFKEHWGHNADRGAEIKQYWDKIPNNTDIVVTHGPSIYKLDYIPYGGQSHVGCADLDYRIQEIKPILQVCGHIHCGYGIDQTIDTIYSNGSICDESYSPINEPNEIILNI